MKCASNHPCTNESDGMKTSHCHHPCLVSLFHPPESTNMSAGIIHITAMALVFFAAVSTPFSDDAAVAAAYWALMPIIGALGASLMAFLLNRVSENRPAVVGRVIGAMVVGVGVPRAFTYIEPEVVKISLDPILLILAGFGCGLFGYAGAKALVDRVFKVAPGVMEQQVDQLATRVAQKTVDKIKEGDATQPLL